MCATKLHGAKIDGPAERGRRFSRYGGQLNYILTRLSGLGQVCLVLFYFFDQTKMR